MRIGPNRDMLTSAFVPFMIKRGYTRVALIAEDTAYGQGLGETIRAGATLAGIDVDAEAFPRDSHDLRPILKRLLARKPQALMVIAEVTPGRTLAITQARGRASAATSCSGGTTSTTSSGSPRANTA